MTAQTTNDRRPERAVKFLQGWDRGETIATHDGRTLRYSDLELIVTQWQEDRRREASARDEGFRADPYYNPDAAWAAGDDRAPGHGHETEGE